MTFKTIMNLGLVTGALVFASCGNSSPLEDPTEIIALAELEDQAFQEEVSNEEIRLERYIKDINAQIESVKEEDKEELKRIKTDAVKMLLELRSDYIKLTDESAAKWVVFQHSVSELIKSPGEEIDYTLNEDDDNSDS